MARTKMDNVNICYFENYFWVVIMFWATFALKQPVALVHSTLEELCVHTYHL